TRVDSASPDLREEVTWQMEPGGFNEIGDQTDYDVSTHRTDISGSGAVLDVTNLQQFRNLRYNNLGQQTYSSLTNTETGSGLNAVTSEERSNIQYDLHNRQLGYDLKSLDAYGNATLTHRSGVLYDSLG